MKKVVLLKDLSGADITEDFLYEKYLELLEKDIASFLMNLEALIHIACPGCSKKSNEDVYQKLGMKFKKCSRCGSIYVCPRPDPERLDDFYRHSEACIFWREQSITLAEDKLRNLHSSRVNWILELTDEYVPHPKVFMDFETKYPYLIRKINDQKLFESVFIYKSRLYEQEGLLQNKDLSNLDSDRANTISVITAFESFERMVNPNELFSVAEKFCSRGGLLLMTTATCSGFEYQVLEENAPNINPINRMNLLSFESLIAGVEAAGFKVVEASTPGRLDVEIVCHALEKESGIPVHPFWRYILEYRDKKTWHDLQQFLQLNRLSSHVRIAAVKR